MLVEKFFTEGLCLPICLIFLATSGGKFPGLKWQSKQYSIIFQIRLKLAESHRMRCNLLRPWKRKGMNTDIESKYSEKAEREDVPHSQSQGDSKETNPNDDSITVL